MKKFLAWLGVLVLVGIVVTCSTFVIMKHVHKNTYKQEAIEWIPALEKVLNKEETSKDEDIVIEDEIQEEQSEDQTSEETTVEETSNEEITTEEETPSDETQTE